MHRLPPDHPLALALGAFLRGNGNDWEAPHEITLAPLKASRPVFRISSAGSDQAVVGKFFSGHYPERPPDRGLAREYQLYLKAPALGLTAGEGAVPRLLGSAPGVGLGLLLSEVRGPDLDAYLARSRESCGLEELEEKLAKLAELLALFHARPGEGLSAQFAPALQYLDKLRRQLTAAGLLSAGQEQVLEREARAWEGQLGEPGDFQVLLHGDATPTNFLFPDGRAVAVDLERMRLGDRLFDLSWVAGELKHAWGWRFGDFYGSERAIGHFFRAYFEALPAGPELIRRIYRLNPFYMAMAELRIARNAYLHWEYRLELVHEALQCLIHGRRQP